ncbi:1,4-dihydroxy-6-naphthoate synthase [Alkalicoccus chagannorensis]|uniref:1,4-dihydroxy-6-naphthoate synthase n=1 Tax=Alkalicoccus chagannorensis TaxID=427072 RepID=UPI00054E1417|nr:1,4-dihydroxy-6-naphthoate synthase [Alkalicoccus chagannorensis]
MKSIAFSPCPNDTFIFHDLVHNQIPGVQAPEEIVYADIDKTNGWAAEQTGPDVMKISFAAFPYAAEHYQLLQCGGALGRGCGPLLLEKEQPEEKAWGQKTIAVPSEKSTAYMLFRLWQKQQQSSQAAIQVLPFDDIMPAVRDGRVDAGLVIHEARFTYHQYGLTKRVDLGEWWEADTGAPIPLGAIIAKKSVDAELLAAAVRTSLAQAWADPEKSRAYVMEHAQEMSEQVADSHIDLYVNEFSMALGSEGRYAVENLLTRAAEEGLVPEVDWNTVWHGSQIENET